MKRQELRDAVSTSTGLTRRQVDDYLLVLTEIVAERLAAGERVELMKLGNLRLRNHQKWFEGHAAPDLALSAPRWSRSAPGGESVSAENAEENLSGIEAAGEETAPTA